MCDTSEKITIPLHVISLRARRARCYERHAPFLQSKFASVHELTAIDQTQIDVHDRATVHPLVAVNMGKLNVDDTLNTVGGIGCYLSHVTLWRRCVQEDRAMLVLEDDIDLECYFAELRPYLRDLAYVPDGTLASLVHSMRDRKRVEPSKAMVHCTGGSTLWCDHKAKRPFLGAMMYYVTPLAATFLLECALPLFLHVDIYIGHIATTHLLCEQSKSDTTSGETPQSGASASTQLPRRAFRVIVARKCVYPFAHFIRDHSRSSIHNNVSIKHCLPESNWIYGVCLIAITLLVVCFSVWQTRRRCKNIRVSDFEPAIINNDVTYSIVQ